MRRFGVIAIGAAFAAILSYPGALIAQEQCTDLEEQIVALISARHPCPSSADKLARFERKVLRKARSLQDGMRLVGRAVNLKTLVDVDAIVDRLAQYVSECEASLGGGDGGDDDSGDGGAPGAPTEGLAARCASYSALQVGDLLIKSEASGHINNGDPRTTGYTVVCARQCPQNLRKADIYYADGSWAASVGYYGTFSGNGQPRLYGAAGDAPQHFVSEIAQKAARIGNGKLYLQMSRATEGASTSCKEFNPTGRNGGL